MTDVAQPAPGQDPQSQPDPTPAAPAVASPASPVTPPPAPAAPGPWSADLAQVFTDPEMRTTADGFLRSKVQPYITQLEQKASQAEPALNLYNDLTQSPVDTYVALTNEIFGEEAGQQLLGSLQQILSQQEQTPAQQQSPQAQSYDPRVQQILEWAEQKQASEYYDSELRRITTAHPEVDPQLIHPFVAAAGGNWDEAYNLYVNYQQQYQAKLNPSLDLPGPPPVIDGAHGAAPSTTPIQAKGQTIEGAIREFAAEIRQNKEAPPVV